MREVNWTPIFLTTPHGIECCVDFLLVYTTDVHSIRRRSWLMLWSVLSHKRCKCNAKLLRRDVELFPYYIITTFRNHLQDFWQAWWIFKGPMLFSTKSFEHNIGHERPKKLTSERFESTFANEDVREYRTSVSWYCLKGLLKSETSFLHILDVNQIETFT